MSLSKFADISIINFDIKLEDCSFRYSSLNPLNISGGTLEMEDSVFSSCEDLIDIIITCSKISIVEYAFMSCEDLLTVSICDDGSLGNEIEINDQAFHYCKRLSDVKIGNGNVKIGSYVFT